jgi:hypothetical protein
MHYWLYVPARHHFQIDICIASFLIGQPVMLGTVPVQKLELGGVILISRPPVRGNGTEIHDKECTDSRSWIVFILQIVVAQRH